MNKKIENIIKLKKILNSELCYEIQIEKVQRKTKYRNYYHRIYKDVIHPTLRRNLESVVNLRKKIRDHEGRKSIYFYNLKKMLVFTGNTRKNE